jgi:hypothetical protein
MIKFNKPNNLNGTELLAELELAGVAVIGLPEDDTKGNIYLNIDETDEAKAKEVVLAHNGTSVAPELTTEAKLALVGINLEDLKNALGLA